MRHGLRLVALGCLLVMSAAAGMAQEAASAPLPTSASMHFPRYEAQSWNNCGPATLTNALSFFGYTDRQTRAAAWLKPNHEDKNVSPWQMEKFVDTQLPELDVYALVRYGGTLDTLRALIANGFPTIIELGFNPEPQRLGWMGHYLLLKGYDDATQQFNTSDSFLGDNTLYSYADVLEYWQHFNYLYIVLYESAREAELMALLGSDADPQQNILNALSIARAEASANTADAFAWFNMGTNFVNLGMYAEAAIAYDEARRWGLPFRMMWYQFGPFEAYYHTGRYDDMLVLVHANLNDGGGQFVEETFYYGGRARLGRGETQRAIDNFNAALAFNPNFTPARVARDQALGG